MKYCFLSVIPVRREPSDPSEIITQMVYGETCTVLENIEQVSNFIKIKMTKDGYEGWVDHKQLREVNSEKDKKYILNKGQRLGTVSLPLGAEVEDNYLQTGVLTKDEVVPFAQKYLNTPYLWGGTSDFGIDCSGFVQQVFKVCGINLPRDAYQQYEIGTEIDFSEVDAGDLIYFGKDRVTHVGIMVSKNEIIHAHGYVRVNKIDSTGILDNNESDYTHQLIGCKRV